MQVFSVPQPSLRESFERRLSSFLCQPIHIPCDPDISLAEKLKARSFELVYIPGIPESQFPRTIARPNRRRYVENDYVEQIPLSAGWVSVETVSLTDVLRSRARIDAMDHYASIDSRFGHNYRGDVPGYNSIIDVLLPHIASRLSLEVEQVSLPSLEERHFIAAWFNYMAAEQEADLPDLNFGTRVWEWCRNQYREDCRIIVSGREEGGMMAVSSGAEDTPDMNTGFRVIVRH